MADIRDKVEQIRQAVYGKDVRESIASGIEAINSEVESTTQRQNAVDEAEAEREAAEEIRQRNEGDRIDEHALRMEEVNDIKDAYDAATKANLSVEVSNARTSAVKSKTFGTLKERLEESEQEAAAHMAENVQDAGGVHGLEVEEGTWTPSLAGATFDVSYATYTRIGNLIKLQCAVNVTVKGTSFVIRGIPFVGVSKTSYGKYVNFAEPLATQQTYYARIDSLDGGRLGIFCSNESGAVTTLIPSVGTFSIDIIYNID